MEKKVKHKQKRKTVLKNEENDSDFGVLFLDKIERVAGDLAKYFVKYWRKHRGGNLSFFYRNLTTLATYKFAPAIKYILAYKVYDELKKYAKKKKSRTVRKLVKEIENTVFETNGIPGIEKEDYFDFLEKTSKIIESWLREKPYVAMDLSTEELYLPEPYFSEIQDICVKTVGFCPKIILTDVLEVPLQKISVIGITNILTSPGKIFIVPEKDSTLYDANNPYIYQPNMIPLLKNTTLKNKIEKNGYYINKQHNNINVLFSIGDL